MVGHRVEMGRPACLPGDGLNPMAGCPMFDLDNRITRGSGSRRTAVRDGSTAGQRRAAGGPGSLRIGDLSAGGAGDALRHASQARRNF
jgi:hypothetical protein